MRVAALYDIHGNLPALQGRMTAFEATTEFVSKRGT